VFYCRLYVHLFKYVSLYRTHLQSVSWILRSFSSSLVGWLLFRVTMAVLFSFFVFVFLLLSYNDNSWWITVLSVVKFCANMYPNKRKKPIEFKVIVHMIGFVDTLPLRDRIMLLRAAARLLADADIIAINILHATVSMWTDLALCQAWQSEFSWLVDRLVQLACSRAAGSWSEQLFPQFLWW